MLDKRSAFLCLKNGHFPRVFLPCCHLVRNGVMNLEALYEPPFTDIHYEGLDGVLAAHADKIISIINRVNANARAA